MKTRMPSSSHLAHTGLNGIRKSVPSTLPPTATPRRLRRLMAFSSCATAGRGAATRPKQCDEAVRMLRRERGQRLVVDVDNLQTSRSHPAHTGLMLSACMSMPCASSAQSPPATCCAGIGDGGLGDLGEPRLACDLQGCGTWQCAHVDRKRALAVDHDLRFARRGRLRCARSRDHSRRAKPATER